MDRHNDLVTLDFTSSSFYFTSLSVLFSSAIPISLAIILPLSILSFRFSFIDSPNNSAVTAPLLN